MSAKTGLGIWSLAGLSWALTAATVTGAEEAIVIEKEAGVAAIRIAVSGYSGEVDSVLKSDLFVVGFTNVPPDQAQYLLSGGNNGSVTGQLTDRFSKAVKLSKAYSDGSRRAQTHALADDVVLAVTGKKGIAQTKIAFKMQTARGSEIYMADYDGFNARQLTQDGLACTPAWMPGRRVLYYTTYKKGFPDIYSYDLSSGVIKAVAAYSGLNTSPALSPDGSRLAMILSKGGSPDVYVADADGRNLRQLTKTREDESSPCWSPDGRTLCYVAREGSRPVLYLISASGGERRRLQTAGLNATEPDWSPDGKSIAFTTQRGGASFEICIVAAAGGPVEWLVPGENPSWAPNARTLIFSRRAKNGRRVLSLLDAPTKQYKDVTQISGSCSEPSWAK
jgi:TolB protein